MMRFPYCYFVLLLFTGCAEISLPLPGQKTSIRDTIYLPVESPNHVAMSADKMNVVYLGIENPMSVDVSGINPWEVKISASQGKIRGNSKHFVYSDAEKIGPVTFTISGPNGVIETFDFIVRRIHDPVAKLGGRSEGKINSSNFKAQKGIYAQIEFFEIDGTCPISGFDLMKISKKEQQIVRNLGGTFQPETLQVIASCQPGDIYLFTEIKVKCLEDKIARGLPPMVFEIR